MAEPELVSNKKRILVDTNVWVSALISPVGAPAQILRAFREDQFILIVSVETIAELADVLARPRIQRRLHDRGDVSILLAQMRSHAAMVRPIGELRLCRDPDDDIVLETAVLGEAQFVVSRDDDIKRDLDLIAHLRANGVEVVSVAQFLALLDEP
jgi:putative PIN family toxin of toxin-antitoxin system